jgi:hypothetical protein
VGGRPPRCKWLSIRSGKSELQLIAWGRDGLLVIEVVAAIVLLLDARMEAAAHRPRGLEASSPAAAPRLHRVRGSHRFHFPLECPIFGRG